MEKIESCQKALNDWYAKAHKGGLSWKALGRKVGRTGSYLSRVAKGDYKPSFEFERDLLAYLYEGREGEVFEYLKAKYPKKITTLASLSAEATKKMNFPRPCFYEALQNRLMYHVYRLADAAKYTVSDLTSLVGPDVPLLVGKMEQEGALRVEKGIVSRAEGHRNQLNINLRAAVQAARHNLSILAHRAEVCELGDVPFDTSQNKVLGVYENLNEAGLMEAIDWMNSSISELRARLQDPKFQGDIPAFINTATGRFDHSNPSN